MTFVSFVQTSRWGLYMSFIMAMTHDLSKMVFADDHGICNYKWAITNVDWRWTSKWQLRVNIHTLKLQMTNWNCRLCPAITMSHEKRALEMQMAHVICKSLTQLIMRNDHEKWALQLPMTFGSQISLLRIKVEHYSCRWRLSVAFTHQDCKWRVISSVADVTIAHED